MIILGGFPSGIVFGPHGVTPAQIATGGSAASPLLNDVDPGDTTTEFLWRLEAAYLAVGVTAVSDAGAYVLTGAPDGTHVQPYRLFALPATGAPSSSTSTITTTVGTSAVAPSIVVQPQPQAVTVGDSAAFSVTATGTAPLAYQWRRNGVNISGATSSSYVLTSAQQTDSGAVFSVVVSNTAGSVPSGNATLTVQTSGATVPVIVAQPISTTVADGSTATFTVAVTGAAPLTYQWQRNGVDIAGATAAQLVLPAVSLVDHRSQYRVRVQNVHGTVVSSRAELVVPVVSVDAAKYGARIDDERFDADIPRWIDTAVRMAEQFCNTYFTPKQPQFDRVDWPASTETFPISQATACTASYWDGAAWVALAPSAVSVWADGNRTGIAPVAGTQWPTLGTVAGGPRVRLVFTAGPTTADSLPIEVQHFVIVHVSLWADENRAAAPQAAQNFPWLYAGLEPLKAY